MRTTDCSVTIHSENEVRRVTAPYNTLLYQILQEHTSLNQYMHPSCGGRGLCGGCAVRAGGEMNPVQAEERYLLGRKINQGFRLACHCFVKGDVAVFLDPIQSPERDEEETHYGVAVLAEETMITAEFYNLTEDKLLNCYQEENRLLAFGANGAERIAYAKEHSGAQEQMRAVVREQVSGIVSHLCGMFAVEKWQLERLILAAGTFFHDLFAGLDIEALPEHQALTKDSMVFEGHQVQLAAAPRAAVELPGVISGAVGSDLEMAILSSGIYRSEYPVLMVDFGTDIRLVLGNRQALFCTALRDCENSLVCRFSTDSGAVHHVWRRKYRIFHEELESAPLGLALSGAVSALSVMQHAGLADQNGKMLRREELKPSKQRMLSVVDRETVFYIDRPHGVFVSQQDLDSVMQIRRALSAGIRQLLARYGVTREDLVAVYVTGEMSYGMTPEILRELFGDVVDISQNLYIAGSMGIGGASLFLRNARARANVEHIRTTAVYVPFGEAEANQS